MELDLVQQSLLATRPCTSMGTMQLIPPSSSKSSKPAKHKMILGENSGCISLYEIKKAEVQTVFTNETLLNSNAGGTGGPKDATLNDMGGGDETISTTLGAGRKTLGSMFSSQNSDSNLFNPSSTIANGGIKSIALGGNSNKKDKIFATNGSKIIGLSKKGKPFFSLTSNSSESTEQILFYQVAEGVNWLEYENLVNEDNLDSEAHLDTLLGCHDRSIRVIRNGECISNLGVDVNVTSLGCYDKNKIQPGPKKIVFGTSSGTVAMLRVDQDGAGAHGWAIPAKSKSRGMVNVLTFSDISKDGVDDIVVGWEDGNIEVLGFDVNPDLPQTQFSANLGESVSSLAVGRLSNAEFEEIVCVGFSGKVVSFTNEPLNTKDASDVHGRTHAKINNENKIRSMQKELEELESKISQKRTQLAAKERAVQLDYSEGSSSGGNNDGGPSVMLPTFDAKTIFALDEEEAAYKISVEIPLEMNLVLLASSVSVDLLDSDTSTATVSRSPPPPDSDLKLCACYRMVEGGSRLQMKIRTTEGEYGEITATIVGNSVPTKSAVVVKLPVKPLSLHCRAVAFREDELERELNVLTLRGSFSVNVAHEWMRAGVPEIPPYVESDEAKAWTFRNVFTGSILKVTYEKDLMRVESDNLSTLAIFKECVSRESMRRRVHVSDSVEVKESTIPGFLGLLHNRLQHLLALSRQVDIIESLKEINNAEAGDTTWMSQEYVEILKNADAIKAEHKQRPMLMNYLAGIITDLFVDRHKLRGVDVRHRIPELQGLINNYDGDALLSVFSNTFDG
ncbi:hypothetical protein TL16_g02598 [Triparma laevis f. inornata]|uniref:Uncharacterized protein n=1 Tax=Triparma laevis f. inornata TaxID=1714386 RepID=A0A9W7DX72_9STRA|nr:hypothetical protein TL16_g02598 [Triparma laevis f. inornata]